MTNTFDKVRDFIDSQEHFLQDRVNDLQRRLDLLENFSGDREFSEEALPTLKTHYEQNLRTNRANLESIASLKQPLNPILNMGEYILMNGYLEKFSTFIADTNPDLYENLESFKRRVSVEFKKNAHLKPEQLSQIFNQELIRYTLTADAEQFVKMMSLCDLFDKYLEARSSFLLSRNTFRSHGISVPSTRIEDLLTHDSFDRETAEIAITKFANLNKPLLIIHKSLQEIIDQPYFYFNEQTRALLNASPTLCSYIVKREKKPALLDPDFCLSDVQTLEKLEIDFIRKVKLIIARQTSSTSTITPSTSQAQPAQSRQQRRFLEKQQQKDLKTKKTVTARYQSQASPSQLKMAISSKPKVTKEAQNVTKVIKEENKRSEVITSPSVDPTLTIVSSLTPSFPNIQAPVQSASLESSKAREVTPALKPKRWRGNMPSADHKSEEKVTKLMRLLSLQETKPTATQNPTKGTRVENLSPQLKITPLAIQKDISRNNLSLLELLASNLAKPDSIGRKDLLQLMEGLGVKVKATTGSIYSLSYENKTKVMHLHETLGRNVLKRSRDVLSYFGFLEQ